MDVVRGWAVSCAKHVRFFSCMSLWTALPCWPRYEHLDKGVSEAFVAERFWWNSLPVPGSAYKNSFLTASVALKTQDGTWIDFTPRFKEPHICNLKQSL